MVARRPLVQVGGTIRELPDGDTLGPNTPLVTRTLPYTNGGIGGTVTTALAATTAGSARFVVKLPVDVSQWRIKIRNWDANETTKTAATLKKLVVGRHDQPLSGTAGETGTFAGSAATTIVSTDQTIPGNGSWYVSPWVTSPGDLFTAGTEFLVAFGYTFASSTAVGSTAGKAWYWTNSTSATDPTIAGPGATTQYIPFDWIIEYTSTSRRKVCLVVGDSIAEGISGGYSALAPTSLWRNAVNLWAADHNRLIVNISMNGIPAANYALDMSTNTYPHYIWNRQGLDTIAFDEVLFTHGSNDFFAASQTLANMQASVQTIVDRMRNTFGIAAPIYMATVLARGASGENSNRTAYNEWLSLVPNFAAGVVDLAGVMRGAAASAPMYREYTPDNIHPTYLGNRRMALELATVLP